MCGDIACYWAVGVFAEGWVLRSKTVSSRLGRRCESRLRCTASSFLGLLSIIVTGACLHSSGARFRLLADAALVDEFTQVALCRTDIVRTSRRRGCHIKRSTFIISTRRPPQMMVMSCISGATSERRSFAEANDAAPPGGVTGVSWVA